MIKLPKVSSETKYKNQYFVHETNKKTFNKKHLDLTTKEYQTHMFVSSLSQPVKDFLGEQVCSQLKELNYANLYEYDDNEWLCCIKGVVNTKYGNTQLSLIKQQQNIKHQKQDNTITLKIVEDAYSFLGERFWKVSLDKETGEIVSSDFEWGLNPLNMSPEELTLFELENNYPFNFEEINKRNCQKYLDKVGRLASWYDGIPSSHLHWFSSTNNILNSLTQVSK